MGWRYELVLTSLMPGVWRADTATITAESRYSSCRGRALLSGTNDETRVTVSAAFRDNDFCRNLSLTGNSSVILSWSYVPLDI